MKLAIVTGHYTSELGYQEVFLARAYARLGHEVRIFTSTAVSPNSRGVVDRAYAPGLTTDPDFGFKILRLPALIAIGANVICRRLHRAVVEFEPETIIIIALAKIFPAPLLREDVAETCRLIAIFGDSREYAVRGGFSKEVRYALQRLLFGAVKHRLYRKAMRYCHTIVLNHAETETVLMELLPAAEREMLRQKSRLLTLGFDPDEFFYDDADRQEVRAKLDVDADEIVLVTATRVNRNKGLESVIQMVSELRKSGMKVRYIIIGFMGDGYEAELKALIESLGSPEAFSCFPFLDREEIRKAFCAADIGVWLRAAISIQQAMGTGLAVILEDKPIVGHLVEDGRNGWYFRAGGLGSAITRAVTELSAEPVARRIQKRRSVLALNSAKLSYDSIAPRIIE